MFRDKELVSKQVDDFRERTQPQIGQVHDPYVHYSINNNIIIIL